MFGELLFEGYGCPESYLHLFLCRKFWNLQVLRHFSAELIHSFAHSCEGDSDLGVRSGALAAVRAVSATTCASDGFSALLYIMLDIARSICLEQWCVTVEKASVCCPRLRNGGIGADSGNR